MHKHPDLPREFLHFPAAEGAAACPDWSERLQSTCIRPVTAGGCITL